jgi:surface polysaccharide O-acyltransferase-like enzyme
MTWELSNLLRVIATTVVIGIHASHAWWFGVNDTTTINGEIFINTLINQVGRLTVPIFVILSGFALAKSEEKRPFILQIFVKRRLWRILPPYIFFTMLHLIGRSQFQNADWLGKGVQICQELGSGMGDYHLYFLGIILQCYICYPIMRRWQFTTKRLWLLISITFLLFTLRWIGATVQYLPIFAELLPHGNHAIYWLPYFQIGIWLTKAPEWSKEFVGQWRSRLWGNLFTIAASLELIEFYWLAKMYNAAEAVGHYTRPTVVLMTLIFLLWSMSWQPLKSPKSTNFIETLAKASFITYLTHVWVLRYIDPCKSFGGLWYVPLAIACSWIVGLVIWKMGSVLKPYTKI